MAARNTRLILVVAGLAAGVLFATTVLSAQEVEEAAVEISAGDPFSGPVVAPVIKGGGPPGNMTPEQIKQMQEQAKRMAEQQAKQGKPEEKNGEKKDESKEGEKQDDGKKDDEKKDDQKDDSAEPVTRPTDPPEPPDPKELELKPDEEGKVRINFRGQSWPDVLQWLADVSKLSLDWQEVPGGYLNLTTQHSYTLDEARDLINRHLLDRGYTLLRNGEILSVVKIEKLNPSMVPRVEPEELAERDPHEFVRVSFLLDWMMAGNAVEELKPMMSTHGKLTPMTATNRLEAIDVVLNLRDVYALLTQEQSARVRESLLHEFPLQYTRASKVREQVAELLGLQLRSSARPGPMNPEMMQQQMKQMQEQAKQMAEMAKQAAKQGGGAPKPKSEGKIYLVANERRNSILALAPPDKLAVIEEAIKMIDVPSDHAHSLLRNKDRMQVYFLESIQPAPLIRTLEDLGDLDFDTRLEADTEKNAIIAYASLADHMTIRALVEKLDGGGRRAEVIQLEVLRAESVVRVVDFMMGGGKEREPKKDDESRRRSFFYPFFNDRDSSRRQEAHTDAFRVDADVKNNTLLLWCNDFELEKVQNLLENLRQNQREGDDPNTVVVHRLETLDPEPFIETLLEMETLDFHTTLKVDEENNAIMAYASAADHAKIRELIDTLDGSSRQFHVIPLRRLEADYVAGTISFMMAGEDDKQESGYSRTYYYNEYYGSGSSRNKQKKPDEFRVDADVEFNRLLLWANELEVKEVQNLLVKLGELPPEGGDPSTTRVLDIMPGPEQQQLLERIRRLWPSLAPNELLLPEVKEPAEQEPAVETGEGEEGEPQEDVTPADAPTTTTAARPRSSVFRLAMLQQDSPPPATPPAPAKETTHAVPPSETPAEPAEAPPAPQQPAFQAPPEDAKDATPKAAAEKPAPVSITQGPDGRLIISSQDTKALDRLEELMSQLAPPRKDYHVFQLKFAEAYWVAWNLKDFFKEDSKSGNDSDAYWSGWYGYPYRSGSSSDSSRRLSKRRALQFISDDDTNTILVKGADPAQLQTIQDLIDLYDTPHLADSESARRTEIFQIRYSKAVVIAEAVKEVYRDLLSSRDKALAKQQDERPRSESRYTYIYGSTGDTSSLEKRPKFKGLLSIGIDELSNTLIVSAPESLFRDVSKMITALDEAAKPVGVVRVMKLPGNVSSEKLRETLSEVLGDGASGRKTPAQKPPGRPPGNGPRPNGNGPFN